MASFKYDLPLLDRDSRFSLWQVNMRALLAQMDLDDALLGHNKMPSKKTATALWLKLEQICMTKDLTSKMLLKQKLFSHKLQEGGSMMDHLQVIKEIVFDLQSMEIKYDGEDLGLSSQAEGLIVRGRQHDKNTNKGHDISECFKLKNKEKKAGTFKLKTNPNDDEKATFVADENSKGEVLVAYVECTKTNDDWICDSGCTFHISPNKEWCWDLEASTT
ncbi:hypothetical protein Tco_1336195 [Tanacetum coccineum]